MFDFGLNLGINENGEEIQMEIGTTRKGSIVLNCAEMGNGDVYISQEKAQEIIEALQEAIEAINNR